MSGRLLLLDAHADPQGGARFFLPHLGRTDVLVSRILYRDQLPDPTAFQGVLITGSKACISDGGFVAGASEGWLERATHTVSQAVNSGIPTLGVCFGHQLLAHAMSEGSVFKRTSPEVGFFSVSTQPDPLLDSLSKPFKPFLSHGDEVRPNPTIEVLAASASCKNQAFRVPGRQAWGVQFHLEYDEQEQRKILHGRASSSPHLNLNPEQMMANAPSCYPQATRLFSRFISLMNA